jgi:hypothetical protein
LKRKDGFGYSLKDFSWAYILDFLIPTIPAAAITRMTGQLDAQSIFEAVIPKYDRTEATRARVTKLIEHVLTEGTNLAEIATGKSHYPEVIGSKAATFEWARQLTLPFSCVCRSWRSLFAFRLAKSMLQSGALNIRQFVDGGQFFKQGQLARLGYKDSACTICCKLSCHSAVGTISCHTIFIEINKVNMLKFEINTAKYVFIYTSVWDRPMREGHREEFTCNKHLIGQLRALQKRAARNEFVLVIEDWVAEACREWYEFAFDLCAVEVDIPLWRASTLVDHGDVKTNLDHIVTTERVLVRAPDSMSKSVTLVKRVEGKRLNVDHYGDCIYTVGPHVMSTNLCRYASNIILTSFRTAKPQEWLTELDKLRRLSGRQMRMRGRLGTFGREYEFAFVHGGVYIPEINFFFLGVGWDVSPWVAADEGDGIHRRYM